MKKILFVSIPLILLITLFAACSKKEDTVIDTSTSSILIQSNWRISYFSTNGNDSSIYYNNIKLTFTAGGAVAAANDILAVNGTWSTYNNDSRNNLLLNFGNTVAFIAELNHDWHIIEKTSVKLRMEDVSGGAGSTDYLTIERN